VLFFLWFCVFLCVFCFVGRGGGLAAETGAPRDAGTWSLQTEAAHETVPALLSALADRGLAMSELRTHSPTLEDVFVSMTGRRLIDDQ
jgi:hypothetical protein